MKKRKTARKAMKTADECDPTLRQKVVFGLGVLVLMAFAWLAYLMFAMRDGPLGAGTWIAAVILLVGGIGLIWNSRRA